MNKALLVVVFMSFYLIDLAGALGINLAFLHGQPPQGSIGSVSDVSKVIDCIPDGETVTLTYSDGSLRMYSCGEGVKGCCLSSEDNGAGCVSNLSCRRVSRVSYR